MSKLTRRELFERIFAASIVTAPAVASGVSLARAASEENPDLSAWPAHQVDLSLNGVQYRLYGVEHSADFLTTYDSELEEHIRNAGVVVLEGNPEFVKREDMFPEFRVYFQRAISLCKKYQKSIIALDSITDAAHWTGGVTALLGAVEAYQGSKNFLSNRRSLLSNSARVILGYYFFGGSSVETNMFNPFGLDFRTPEELDISVERQKYFHNHYIDQCNVAIAERLLQRPLLRRMKSAMYGWNYGLIDNDAIEKFTPTEEGWRKEVLGEV